MKIKIEVTPSFETSIHFFDACKGIIAKLEEVAQQALNDGDHEPLIGTVHVIREENDDAEDVGTMTIVED